MRCFLPFLFVLMVSGCDSDPAEVGQDFVPASETSLNWAAEGPRYDADDTIQMILDNNSDETLRFLKLCGVWAVIQDGEEWVGFYRTDCSSVFELPTTLAPGQATVVRQWLPGDRFPQTATTAWVQVRLSVLAVESGKEFVLSSAPIEVYVP